MPDVQITGMSGLGLHGQLATIGLHIATIFITAYLHTLPPLPPRALTIYLPKPCEANTRLKHFETAMRRSTKSTWLLQLPTRYKPSYKSTQQRYVVFVPMHKCAG